MDRLQEARYIPLKEWPGPERKIVPDDVTTSHGRYALSGKVPRLVNVRGALAPKSSSSFATNKCLFILDDVLRQRRIIEVENRQQHFQRLRRCHRKMAGAALIARLLLRLSSGPVVLATLEGR
ncbi:hypothetical protein V1477_016000 [Vespula maculifrons]|uniref:Uncharacterized protein n=1 Tax=Vespula maculifrons TaxID=7453 RepID=A0ABD2BBT3_VESMC